MEIPLTKGRVALIDDEDYDLVSAHRWHAHVPRHAPYWAEARTNIAQRPVSMHRFLLGANAGSHVDHINGDALDNRRANLRFATRSQNQMNRHRVTSRSGYKGVYLSRVNKGKPFAAKIRLSGRNIHLGFFDKAADAAKKYDDAARELFGTYASLNFP